MHRCNRGRCFNPVSLDTAHLIMGRQPSSSIHLTDIYSPPPSSPGRSTRKVIMRTSETRTSGWSKQWRHRCKVHFSFVHKILWSAPWAEEIDAHVLLRNSPCVCYSLCALRRIIHPNMYVLKNKIHFKAANCGFFSQYIPGLSLKGVHFTRCQ